MPKVYTGPVRFASLYSGIGGTDCGLVLAGWTPVWQAECDPLRQAVLQARFVVPVFTRVEFAGARAPAVDVLHADLPDARVDLWWPAAFGALWRTHPRQWFVCEFSPSGRCDVILRDLALDGWAFRVLLLTARLVMRGDPLEGHECRKRGLVFASREANCVDRLGIMATGAEIVIGGLETTYPVGSVEWYEVSRGFRAGWSCGCRGATFQPGMPCDCDPEARIAALGDAASPFVGQWLAELLDGRWRDGLTRQFTAADGTEEIGVLGCPCAAVS